MEKADEILTLQKFIYLTEYISHINWDSIGKSETIDEDTGKSLGITGVFFFNVSVNRTRCRPP